MRCGVAVFGRENIHYGNGFAGKIFDRCSERAAARKQLSLALGKTALSDRPHLSPQHGAVSDGTALESCEISAAEIGLNLVVRQGVQLTIIGIIIGLAGAAALTRVVSSLLFNTHAYDPVTFVAVPTLLAAVALAATIIPAWRATRVDPMVALREE